jgi:hypothetical protein
LQAQKIVKILSGFDRLIAYRLSSDKQDESEAKMKQVSHNPFARESMIRENVYVTVETCAWCGNVRKTKTGKAYLYRYGIEPDDKPGRISYLRGLYCDAHCMRAHHDIR